MDQIVAPIDSPTYLGIEPDGSWARRAVALIAGRRSRWPRPQTWLRGIEPEVKSFVCPRGHEGNASIRVACAEEGCGAGLVLWPSWYRASTFRRTIFVNALRTGALWAAFGIATLGLVWPVYVYLFGLTFLLLGVHLRGFAWAERRTLRLGLLIFGVFGALHYFASWPISSELIVAGGLAALLALTYVRLTLLRPADWPLSRMRVFLLFPTTLAVLAIVLALEFVLRRADVSGLDLIDLAIAYLTGSLIVGVIVTGVSAGLHETVPGIKAPRLKPPQVQFSRRLMVKPRRGSRPAFERLIEDSVYQILLPLHMLASGTIGSIVWVFNGVVRQTYAVINGVISFTLQFIYRLATVVLEIVMVALDAVTLTFSIFRVFIRYYFVPMGLILVLALAAATLSDAVGRYVGKGALADLAAMGVGIVGLLVGTAGLIVAQTQGRVSDVIEAIASSVRELMASVIIYFIVLSFGLAFTLGNFLPSNPFRVGVLTIGAAAIIVLACVMYMLGLFQSTKSLSEISEPTKPFDQGRPVQVAGVMAGMTLLGLCMILLDIATHDPFGQAISGALGF